MDNPLWFWSLVAVLGLCTFAIRSSFIVLMNGRRFNGAWISLLSFIPASVLAALSIPALLYAHSGSNELADPERLLAGIFAIGVAYYSKNILLTITSGMMMLWLLRWLFAG